MGNDISKRLCELLVPPKESSGYDSWLKQTDFIEFLEKNAKEDHVIIYASVSYDSVTACPASLFLYSILVPEADVSPPDVDDLLKWSVNREAGWSVREEGRDVRIESLLRDNHSKSLAQGEYLLFNRSFEGVSELDYYMEISQKFSHVFGIHHMPERKAWCRLDHRGDIENVAREVKISPSGECRYRGRIVLFNRDILEMYAALAETALVRMFDFDRFCNYRVSYCEEKAVKSNGDQSIFYRYGEDPGNRSYTRGVQIIQTPISRKEAAKKIYRDFSEDECQQEKFIVARDFENKKTEEISYEDGMLFETAFFRPEVLSKYNADSEKYSFEEDCIDCRNSWSLEFYDINEPGQIYVFLRHLSYLPHEEQLHWKQFNEKPKAPVSPHVIKRFVLGEPYLHYSPLRTLKDKLRNLRCEWWKMPSPDAINKAQYPVTGSNDEWREEFLNLDQLLVEGFEEKWLRSKAKELGRTPEQSSRSLKLLEECLIGLGFEEDHARSIISPLREVHDLRTKLKGHASGEDAQRLKKEAFEEHGSYLKHYKNLAAKCDEAILILTEAFQDPRMN